VVIDTREQAPYTFDPARVVSVSHALPAGDYSLQGYENRVAIERKSLDDFVGTVIRARGRFEIELGVLEGYEFACVVVEASIEDVLLHRYRMAVHPNSVMGSAIAITLDHHIPVFFCGTRQHACHFVEGLLCRFHKLQQARTPSRNSVAESNPSSTPRLASQSGD
jgi:ERCC4-type nuclease